MSDPILNIPGAIQFNLRAARTLWAPEQLPDDLHVAYVQGAEMFARAVARAQQNAGLKVDGKLGPITLATLNRLQVKPVAKPYLRGIDVSGYQNRPNFDFAKLATAGLSFAFVKLTQESFRSNKDAEWQVDAFYDMGLAVGFYHFCDVSESASRQAELLHREAQKFARGRPYLPLAADYEWLDDHNHLASTAHRAWVAEMVSRLRTLDRRDPILYTGPNMWRQYLKTPIPELGDVHLWVVDYSKPEAPPTLPPGFKDWRFRQFTGSGRVPGYSGDIDLNFFNGDQAALSKLTEA